jgi:hypothetical protein
MLSDTLARIRVGAHQCWRDYLIIGARLTEHKSQQELGQVRELREQMIEMADVGIRLAILLRDHAAAGLKEDLPIAVDICLCRHAIKDFDGTHHDRRCPKADVVRAAGLEPATSGLEGRCSIQTELRPPAIDSSSESNGDERRTP